jgi:hypothetical protein
MTSPRGEAPQGGEIAMPAEITAFVDDTLAAFASANGEGKYTPPYVLANPQMFTNQDIAPVYEIAGIPYNPQLISHLAPFDTCLIDAADMSVLPQDQSYVAVSLSSYVNSPKGKRQVFRQITLWHGGDIQDSLNTDEKDSDPDEPRKPKSMSREDIHEYSEYQLGKQALRAAFDEMEGMPKVTPQITKGELEDLRKLMASIQA